MKHLKHIILVILLLGVSLGPISSAHAQQKYALLISAGNTTHDDDNYHSEYWYDLFLMYRTLIEAGFTHNNIFVLYGNGADFASAHADYQTATVFPGLASIVDFPNSKADVEDIFDWLATGNAIQGVPQIQDPDYLFYWWMGHGGTEPGMPDCEYRAKIENTNEYVYDHEFANYFGQLPACVVKTPYVMTCHSGGLIDDLEGLHYMIHTAAPCDKNAFSAMYDVVHAELSYHAACAFREVEPGGAAVASDTDGDLLVNCDETNVYAHANTASSVTQIGDMRCIAPLVFVDNAAPAAGVPLAGVYSRDFAEDDGAEPSDYMSHIWYKGPDLWVRHAQDGIETPEDPEFGQPNYVYARLHNIGCNDLNVDVELSWCLVSAWSNPASWNTIASFTEPNLLTGESRVVNSVWNTVPAPGSYCLHTVLDAAGDAANADGRAYMDNNKVQINVTVDDVHWAWGKALHWFIENGLSSDTLIDLVIDRLDLCPQTGLRLQIPGDLKFKTVLGADTVLTRDVTTIVASSKEPLLILKGVRLAANARREAIITLSAPRGTSCETEAQLRVSEQLNGREVGGIVFNLVPVDKQTMMESLFRKARNFFAELQRRFDVAGAKEMSAAFGNAQQSICSKDIKAAGEALADLPEMRRVLGQALTPIMEADDFRRFDMHLGRSADAVRASDWAAFATNLEEGMLATRDLFLNNR